MIIPRDRQTLRKRSVPHLIKTLAVRHPELREPVTYGGFLAIARREKVTVQILPLSRPGRLIRVGAHVFVQLNKPQSIGDRTLAGMHELCHFWRDDPGEACYNVEDDALLSDAEEFADIFAWMVTSPARIFYPGLRDEDF